MVHNDIFKRNDTLFHLVHNFISHFRTQNVIKKLCIWNKLLEPPGGSILEFVIKFQSCNNSQEAK